MSFKQCEISGVKAQEKLVDFLRVYPFREDVLSFESSITTTSSSTTKVVKSSENSSQKLSRHDMENTKRMQMEDENREKQRKMSSLEEIH